MDREEAALRAKIQAVRNLLAVKQRPSVPQSSWHGNRAGPAPFAPSYTSYHSRKPALPVNKTWTRTTTAVVPPPRVATVQSANKVWMNADAVRNTPAAVGSSLSSSTPTKTPTSTRMNFAQHVRSRMQLQMLRLEDGEYAKANGGFSLVRSDVMATKAAEKTAALSAPQNAAAKRPSYSTSSAASRAQAAVARARASTRAKAAKSTRVRTEYCRFFNKFGKSSIEIIAL